MIFDCIVDSNLHKKHMNFCIKVNLQAGYEGSYHFSDLKTKGLNFVFGKELQESMKSCLVELLRNQYDALTIDFFDA